MLDLAGVFGWLGGLVGGSVSSLAGDAITALAQAVLGALGHAVEWASTLWVGIGTPPVSDQTARGRRRGRSRSYSRTCWCSRPGWRSCAR
jgi:hypothetical protein